LDRERRQPELELRRDPFTGRQVWFVPSRIGRPSDWVRTAPSAAARDAQDCPFCPGHEDQTPPEIWALRDDPDDPASWQIRVIPNKYPLSEAHELIIETPQHGLDLADLSEGHLALVIEAYKRRFEARAREGRWRTIALFKNHGRGAGATRVHPHAQLVGLPFVPPLLRAELSRAWQVHRRRGRCLYCETLEHELQGQERIVDRNEHFVAWSPYAARMSLECWLLPRRHRADFLEISPHEMRALAQLLGRTLKRLKAVLPERAYAYNFYLHTLPLSAAHVHPQQAESYHWHFEIVPRLGRLAGLEWGTGLYVNPVFPEEAARLLRDAL
jgi:UDPglucose--hexose-1-phosphate uridylyltransferase